MRKLEDIQTEYNQTCAHLGSTNYRMHIIEEDFKKVQDELQKQIDQQTVKLKELSLEAESINKKTQEEQAAKPVEAEVVQ